MTSRMDEFRNFVTKHPKVRDEVANGKKSWQNIYEDWVLLGENDAIWNQYKEKSTNFNIGDLLSGDNLKGIIGYVKKINPDSLGKTLNSIQKVLQISQSVGARSRPGVFNANYNSWWD